MDNQNGEKVLQEEFRKLSIELEQVKKEFSKQLQEKDEVYQARLTELKDHYKNRETIFLKRLKENEANFQKELNTQIQIIKQSWSWRIIHLFLKPLEIIISFFQPVKPLFRAVTGMFKAARTSGISNAFKLNNAIKKYDFQNQVIHTENKNIASIFDEFTRSCFSNEFNIIAFTPSNWKNILASTSLDAFFIESAWKGIGNSWRNKIVFISPYNQGGFFKLLKWVKSKHIPTVFWNKEDPVHFGGFISVAKEFDYIFTTDADCIPDYQKAAGHQNVFALPFAAQPLVHNPVRTEERTARVCFAGTYHSKKYADRRADMEFLLSPSKDYGLDIFDRNFGTSAERAGIYRFPDKYQENIRGRLEYDEMVKAYKRYKVFLNVNSVKYSPTMFARRVFELLACGTPVISTYSEGIINLLGEDAVFITESEEDTRKHLEYLLGNEMNWWKASLNGIRKVMEHHTYEERVRYIFNTIDLGFKPPSQVKFSIVSKPGTIEEIQYLAGMVHQQNYSKLDVILVLKENFINQSDLSQISVPFKPYNVFIISADIEQMPTAIKKASDSDYIAFFHSDKYYGPNYIRDYALAIKYANPTIMGKKSFCQAGEGSQPAIPETGFEYSWVDQVKNATLVLEKSSVKPDVLRECLNPGELSEPEASIFSIDPFNFLDAGFNLTPERPGSFDIDKVNL